MPAEHARHYAQILDASDPDQSADDDFRLAQAPPEVLRGSFRIYYIPRDDSSYGSTRYLLSVQMLEGHLAFLLEPSAGDTAIAVYVNETLRCSLGPVEFEAGEELEIEFAAPNGRITLNAPTSGESIVSGSSWNVAGSVLRVGGNVEGADLARGYVSLPYAVPGAALPDAIVLTPTMLDFSDPANSALLSLI